MPNLLSRLFRKRVLRFEDISGRKLDDQTYNRIRNRQTRLAMEILEKGRRVGFDKLSQEEKDFLEAYSKSGFAQ